MKALVFHSPRNVSVDTVDDPQLKDNRDAIIKITSTAICGSDLHIYNGLVPQARPLVLGHEFMGEVVEIGTGVKKLKVGDKVVVPFTISCGKCFFCKKKLFSACELSNPNEEMARKQMGHSPAGLFGFSHLLGGFSGGGHELHQAFLARFLFVEYARDGALENGVDAV